MAAQAEPSLKRFTRAHFRQGMPLAFHGCTGLLVVGIGVLGLLDGSRARQLLETWINIHALFALLLCVFALTRCQWHMSHAPVMLPADMRKLSRHLSRIVYLVLYLVIGVTQSISIVSHFFYGSAVDFNLFDDRFRHGPDRPGWNPRDDFQLFLATGLFAIIVVKIWTFRLWLRAVELTARPSKAVGAPSK
jgi:hypothetical protein